MCGRCPQPPVPRRTAKRQTNTKFAIYANRRAHTKTALIRLIGARHGSRSRGTGGGGVLAAKNTAKSEKIYTPKCYSGARRSVARFQTEQTNTILLLFSNLSLSQKLNNEIPIVHFCETSGTIIHRQVSDVTIVLSPFQNRPDCQNRH
ncbi:hypothetical protein Zmor_019227 [Zophobas morio]|uniref:Uncharacterized protein n=1 Tax=Zophobas morio TaxID=2755281 RepID=A0AA38I0W7_9CUCU|nr:hypothetical protein Zmor_019227 [Zophobas morio]